MIIIIKGNVQLEFLEIRERTLISSIQVSLKGKKWH